MGKEKQHQHFFSAKKLLHTLEKCHKDMVGSMEMLWISEEAESLWPFSTISCSRTPWESLYIAREIKIMRTWYIKRVKPGKWELISKVLLYSYSGILFSNYKEWTTDICWVKSSIDAHSVKIFYDQIFCIFTLFICLTYNWVM